MGRLVPAGALLARGFAITSLLASKQECVLAGRGKEPRLQRGGRSELLTPRACSRSCMHAFEHSAEDHGQQESSSGQPPLTPDSEPADPDPTTRMPSPWIRTRRYSSSTALPRQEHCLDEPDDPGSHKRQEPRRDDPRDTPDEHLDTVSQDLSPCSARSPTTTLPCLTTLAVTSTLATHGTTSSLSRTGRRLHEPGPVACLNHHFLPRRRPAHPSTSERSGPTFASRAPALLPCSRFTGPPSI